MTNELVEKVTRPIVGIENRTSAEVFDIMADRFRAALASVGEAKADGWLFFNPDTGTEWSANHPVESGEVDDAENIRPATAEELRQELFEAWEALATPPAPVSEPRVAVTDAMVETALTARIPGGSLAWHWIDGGGTGIQPAHRDVMRAALEAVLASEVAVQPTAAPEGWRSIETAPNRETIIVLRDDDTVEIVPADDNDFNWVPYTKRETFCTKPMGWLPMSFLPAAPKQDV